VEPHEREHGPHVPPPSLWPVGFAVGIAVLLAGLIVSWWVVALGAVLAVVFGFLWIRDATAEMRGPVPEIEPERRALAAATTEPALGEPEVERFPRNKFLEASTLGIGAVIGGIVTLPVLGFAVAPAFVDQGEDEVDLGPVENFPEGQFMITKFLLDPSQGEVSARTTYVRKNADLDGVPSFTILSNRCVHLGCPVQPNGPIEDDNRKAVPTEVNGRQVEVGLTPTTPAGFGCPCHGGQYDTEGNRTAGPPVRALDRFQFSIRNERLFLGEAFSVGTVDGTAENAEIHAYDLAGPGEHIDDWQAILYPIQAPH
jgi:quinol---cytochrome c reductase iron-sulfur subunit, bacillus type